MAHVREVRLRNLVVGREEGQGGSTGVDGILLLEVVVVVVVVGYLH